MIPAQRRTGSAPPASREGLLFIKTGKRENGKRKSGAHSIAEYRRDSIILLYHLPQKYIILFRPALPQTQILAQDSVKNWIFLHPPPYCKVIRLKSSQNEKNILILQEIIVQ